MQVEVWADVICPWCGLGTHRLEAALEWDGVYHLMARDADGMVRQVFSVAFSPSGATVAAGSADSTVRLWDTQARAAAAGVCATEGQPLTRAEWGVCVPGRRYVPPCG